jgi:sRNA-binding regulator protein Hfq
MGRISLPMPKEILAEEIERFLGTVEGVASARLLTSPSGEIDQIYVTADDRTEGRTARRAVVAVLMTQYGIPLEPWRVQVAHLKRFSPAELPNLKMLRVEETIAGNGAQAKVQVVWERAGEQRTGTGQAQGPSGPQHRMRVLAAAAVEAARAVIDPPHRRITVQQVSSTTCMDRPLVLVGITVGGPRGQEAFVGSAFHREGTSDAPVAAALDAVTKWLLRAAFDAPEEGIEADRRAHLEAMRHFLRAGGKARPGEPQGSASPAPTVRAPAPPSSEPAEPMSPDPAPDGPNPTASASSHQAVDGSSQAEGQSGSAVSSAPADILEDLQQIRPEQKGGAAMAAQHESSRVGVASGRPGRQAVEDEFLQPLIDGRTPLHIRCRDGYEIPRAVLREIGTYTLVVEVDGTAELVYKHAIISIGPAGARA